MLAGGENKIREEVHEEPVYGTGCSGYQSQLRVSEVLCKRLLV